MASIALLLFSCEKTIEFKGEETQPLLVVNSIVQPDSALVASVTNSVFFLSDNYIMPVENANVQLFVNNNFVEKMQLYNERITDLDYRPNVYYNHSVYISDYKIKTGDKIRYEISAPNFDKVWAENTVPAVTEIISLDTVVEKITQKEQYDENYYSHYNFNFSLKFKDNANEKNYYRLTVDAAYFYYDEENEPVVMRRSPYYFDSKDMIFNNDPLTNTDGEYHSNGYDIFSDDLINGKEYSLSFSFLTDYNVNANLNGNIFYIQLQSLSSEYYMYLRTLSSQNNEMGIFAEPTQIFNNINGGIGILGAFSVSEKMIVYQNRNKEIPYAQ